MSQYKVCGYDMEQLHARMLEIAMEVDRICLTIVECKL